MENKISIQEYIEKKEKDNQEIFYLFLAGLSAMASIILMYLNMYKITIITFILTILFIILARRINKMDKRGGTGLIITLIIFGVILVAGILTALIILNQHSEEKEKEIYGSSSMNIYIIAKDSQYGTFLNGKYFVSNITYYIEGDLKKDAFAEINNLSDKAYTDIICQSNNYYSTRINKSFTSSNIKYNSSKIYCTLDKVGVIKVSSDSVLKNGENKIKIVVLAIGEYRNLSVCASWTSGIKLLNSTYAEMEIPTRFNNKVDKCYDLNISLENNSTEMYFYAIGDVLNTLDKVYFYIFDKDWQVVNDKAELVSEFNGANVGNKEDKLFLINYYE